MAALVQADRLEAGVLPAAPRPLGETASAHDPTPVALSLWAYELVCTGLALLKGCPL
jgi:hypothetical protein